jgi:Type VI secretion system/phage-baseplate injector OB domain
MSNDKYFGKFRGTVTNNLDPESRGRLIVMIPNFPDTMVWAEACVPFLKSPAKFDIPPVGMSVWVEFEQGDPDYPIWVGCQITKT